MRQPSADSLTTAQVAERSGVNVETVRYYERRGLLPEPPRRPSGYRQYGAEHVARIRFIKRAQDLGFRLDEIAELLSLRAAPGTNSRAVKQRTEQKIREIDDKLRDLQQIRRTLAELASACDGHGTTGDCPILQALDGMSDGCHEPGAHALPAREA